jgi:ABC-type dipeptide/oligopeptide/nickel transport system ATPase component
MYKSITIRNFRALTELQVDNLGPINLFVGRNNCGKTTFLEGVFLLVGGTNPRLPININGFRGLSFIIPDYWPTFFHNMQVSVPIEIQGQSQDGLSFQTLRILPRKRGKRIPLTEQGGVAAIDVMSASKEKNGEMIGLELQYQTDSRSHTSSVYIDQEKKELDFSGGAPPDKRGVFVGPLVPPEWKERFDDAQREKRLPELIQSMKEIEPSISDIRLNAIGLLEADIGLPKLLPVNLLGGGFSRSLTIALDMLSFQNGVVLIDEIENGLHHSAQSKVWEGIFQWAMKYNVQVFASTHSLECIHAFHLANKPGLFGGEAKVFRIEREEDFRVVEMTREDISVLLENGWEMR